MLLIHQIKVPIEEKLNSNHIAHKLKCSTNDIISYEIERESLDARKELLYSYSVYCDIKNERKYLRNKDVTIANKEIYQLPILNKKDNERPIVAGFGPAGMFASLILAECGLKPIILERGSEINKRTKDVELFFKEGKLNEESNVQYGEGGAGTFSDGKLTTRIKNFRISKVLDEFVEAGANPAITYMQRPHLGTDVLREIVFNIRQKIIKLGGEIHFGCEVKNILKDSSGIYGLKTNKGDFLSKHIILAIGHSASDTYANLLNDGIHIEQKDFAAGVRVEHPQVMINENQYGRYANHPMLGAASYQLTYMSSIKRGVYSFCMCPGGVVVPSSTINGHLSVNGMSYAARDKNNANSAILVQIPRKDFDKGHPLDGFIYQKELEKHSYLNGFKAPVSNIEDYLNNHLSTSLNIKSSYPLETECFDMHKLFSYEVNQALSEGFINFDHKIKGFISNGIMIGMESRSSSPIRILRDENGECISLKGLYPAGEGAGYAGGIISSAVDGIRQAENIIYNLNK